MSRNLLQICRSEGPSQKLPFTSLTRIQLRRKDRALKKLEFLPLSLQSLAKKYNAKKLGNVEMGIQLRACLGLNPPASGLGLSERDMYFSCC